MYNIGLFNYLSILFRIKQAETGQNKRGAESSYHFAPGDGRDP